MTELASRYTPFTRLKAGTGRAKGYRMGTPEQLAALEADNGVVYRSDRYGNIYIVDRPGLDHAMKSLRTPVVHLGRMVGMERVAAHFPARWVRVLLWCSKETTAHRSPQRGDSDTAARLAAWDETQADLAAHPRARWELRVDTDRTAPREAARGIDDIVRATRPDR
ncbi:guanylate kinase [Streptomyces uncialis]|uniref:guanylate kinase n=1 Tax=Streptomyces uncialis TaxID=1048205 RepID=UPI00366663DB